MNIIETKVVEKESDRNIEIYIITNLINNKQYIGQTVSHVLNCGIYKRYGAQKRLDSHISETFSNKKNQCHYLNNAIKKYGKENFIVEVIKTCSKEESDNVEKENILKYNTIFPNGYNLKIGGNSFIHSDESKRRLSVGVKNYYKQKKLDKFKDIIIEKDFDLEKYIHPARRNGNQYGWYVIYKGVKVDFGGIHISLEESKQMADEFFKLLTREQAF